MRYFVFKHVFVIVVNDILLTVFKITVSQASEYSCQVRYSLYKKKMNFCPIIKRGIIQFLQIQKSVYQLSVPPLTNGHQERLKEIIRYVFIFFVSLSVSLMLLCSSSSKHKYCSAYWDKFIILTAGIYRQIQFLTHRIMKKTVDKYYF